jgi:hypothetical protein
VLSALIHTTASPHATTNREDGMMKRARASQSFHQGETSIADHLSKFDQTTLLILLCQENNEPMLYPHSAVRKAAFWILIITLFACFA